MASYNEQVLFSSIAGVTGNFSLSGNPSAYNSIRVCYGSPNIGDTGTSLNNLGPMYTVTYPTAGRQYVDMYGMFFGGVNTTTCNTPYRIAAAFSACSSTNWNVVFNRYGSINQGSMTQNAPWTRIYSVIGIQTGSQGNFHKDLLYDMYRDGMSSTINLTAHPSGYKRIGIVVGLNTGLQSQTMDVYQEYMYETLSSRKDSNIMTWSKYTDSPTNIQNNMYTIGMWGNCSGSSWTRRYGMAGIETGGNPFDNNTPHAWVKQVIGIDRI